jgi:thymidylate synthase (FAD)
LGSVKLIWITPDAEKHIAYCARVSSPNQENPDYAKLLKYCIDHRHWSVFEMASACLEITTTRSIAPQILRHKSFCLDGDTKVYFDLPESQVDSKRHIYKISMRGLWDRWQPRERNSGTLFKKGSNFGSLHKRDRVKNMRVRCLDEQTRQLSYSRIVDVIKSEPKEMFSVTLSDGKSITCSKDHRFLFKDGWASLADGAGLCITGKILNWTSGTSIFVNGIECYKDKQWLKNRYHGQNLYLTDLANEAGVTIHTIRKWLKIHGLGRKHSGMIPWNKGKTYHTGMVVSESHKAAIRAARTGEKSNWWRGGVSKLPERRAVGYWTTAQAPAVHARFNYTCQLCGERGGALEVHHIIPVWADMGKARDLDNLCSLCDECHSSIAFDELSFAKQILGGAAVQPYSGMKQPRGLGHTLVPRLAEIVGIRPVGERDCYDLSVEGPNHNFVANGIITHNSFQEFSQRYAAVGDSSVELPDVRRQDQKNRQASHDDFPENTKTFFKIKAEHLWKSAYALYDEMLQAGVAKECARLVLPGMARTKLYMSGTIRSWMTYFMVRCQEDVQKEHRDLAIDGRALLAKELPVIAKACEWVVSSGEPRV